MFFSIGCTDISGEIKYFCLWPNDKRKIIPSAMAQQLFPQMIIEYLENNVDLNALPERYCDEMKPSKFFYNISV